MHVVCTIAASPETVKVQASRELICKRKLPAININKCEIVPFSHSSKSDLLASIVDGAVIPVRSEAKCLGVVNLPQGLFQTLQRQVGPLSSIKVLVHSKKN